MPKVRVLVVDDSSLVRTLLTKELSKDPDIEVIGSAPDAFVARDMIVALRPDVITLDIEMPKMDGITFLRKLMEWFPIPVVIVSGLTPKGCSLSLEALDVGAVEVIEKPSLSDDRALADFSTRLIDTVKAASFVKMRKDAAQQQRHAQSAAVSGLHAPKPQGRQLGRKTNKLVAIGASTGGTEALKAVLYKMPVDCPPIMIVQHMPGTFTKAFAERLNRQTPIEVLEAEDGMEVKAGRAIIGNGNLHLLIRRSGSRWLAETREGPLVCRHKPSVEVLFNSFAKQVGQNAIGVMLTGMGRDGADAMKNMRDAGARNIAQDEKSCVVFGMPKEAIKVGAVEKIVPLDKLADMVISWL
ncbi:MAG: chemotaxis response regulator protein-glutamate methylesterase [Planctomycetota bacterium]|jgi:two-component system chemotaxis response regulator CheB|nr:chemotaxis response regulator protein-glutamate methylesterase [Planctomycetota bacterium]